MPKREFSSLKEGVLYYLYILYLEENAPSNCARHWTPAEEELVLDKWGTEPQVMTAIRVNRTFRAVAQKIAIMRGKSAVFPSSYISRIALAHQLGVAITRIRMVVKNCDLKLERLVQEGGSGWFAITPAQAQVITEFIQRGPQFLSRTGEPRYTWANKFSCCQTCGTDGYQIGECHSARGLCINCYAKDKYQKDKAKALA